MVELEDHDDGSNRFSFAGKELVDIFKRDKTPGKFKKGDPVQLTDPESYDLDDEYIGTPGGWSVGEILSPAGKTPGGQKYNVKFKSLETAYSKEYLEMEVYEDDLVAD